MFKRMVLGLLCILTPSVACAQPLQESYLPTNTQLYFRFDGFDKHQAAFDKTAVGKMLKGDTGKFLDEFCNYVYDNLQTAAQNEPKVGPILKDLSKVLVTTHKSGLVMGIEVDKVNPPMVQAVFVFPKGAGESGTVLSLIQKIAEESQAKVNTVKVGKRFVNSIEVEIVKLGWWAQGSDAVVFLGTTDPVAFAKDIDMGKTGITKHLLYQRVANFKEFETAARGYFDVASVLKVAGEIAEPAPKIIDELGLKGLKSIVFFTGYEGLQERSVVEADIPGPRKGLLSLAGTKKITLADLPKLPDDLTSFNAGTANISKSYDIVTNLVYGILTIAAPNEVDNIKEGVKAFEKTIGVDISNDLFGCFGETVVSYSSPSDGFLWTGAVVAIQLKDAKKLNATLEKVKKAIPPIPGGEIQFKKSKYHGGEINQIGISGPQANAHMLSFGIYKDWFIYSQYPVSIKGFILRQEGVLPAWKADDDLKKMLAQFPNEFNSIAVSDPRPVVKTALAIAPIALNILNTLGPLGVPGYRPFDLDLLPHPQEASRHLFPNVTVGIDDGKRVRAETRGSLLLPF